VNGQDKSIAAPWTSAHSRWARVDRGSAIRKRTVSGQRDHVRL